MNDYFTIATVLIVLFCLSVFFALCETSFSSASRIKLKNMADKDKSQRRSKQARLVLKLLDRYDKLLSSVLIGNTIVNVFTSALATMLCIRLFGAKGVSIAAAIVTVTVLIFTEISPKTLAKEMPEITALRTAPLLRLFMFIFAPFNYLASSWKKVIIKIFPVKTNQSVTEDELLTFVEEVRQEGGINKHEEHMIRQVIEFDDMTAAEIITPRVDLTAIPENASAEEINKVFSETRFSRLPVYRGTIDNITGVMLFKDFYYEVIKQNKPLSEIIKPVLFVTKTIKIRKLLQTLQEKQAHMAVLVDEFGGTLGVVTIEDIIEELVGEIWDEHDEVEEEFGQNDDGSLTVLGKANIHDMITYINTTLGTHLPETAANTTVGNWAVETYGSLPRCGDHFEWHNLHITVSRVQRHRVMEIQVRSE